MKKTFILMRHAKSDWLAGINSDFERPLNARGRRDCESIGGYFRDIGVVPDKILHSAARRTTETMELVCSAAQWSLHEHMVVQKSESLYLCSADQLIWQVSQTAPDVQVLLVVNHQPTCSDVIESLCGQWVEFKTSNLVVVECEIEDWGLIEVGEKWLVEHFSL